MCKSSPHYFSLSRTTKLHLEVTFHRETSSNINIIHQACNTSTWKAARGSRRPSTDSSITRSSPAWWTSCRRFALIRTETNKVRSPRPRRLRVSTWPISPLDSKTVAKIQAKGVKKGSWSTFSTSCQSWIQATRGFFWGLTKGEARSSWKNEILQSKSASKTWRTLPIRKCCSRTSSSCSLWAS